MLWFHIYKIIFFFLFFPIYNNLFPKYCQSYKKDDCQLNQPLFNANYYSMKQLKKSDLLFLANKFIEKIPDPRIEHYQSFLKKKNRKSVKHSEIITYYLKTQTLLI